MAFTNNDGMIRNWRQDSFEEMDASDGDTADPLEQTTNPHELAAAVAASRTHSLRQTTNPAELVAAIQISRASSEESEKKKRDSSQSMAEALAESRAYEASREDEARRRHFAAEDAAQVAAREFAALNERTRETINALLGDRDCTAALRRATEAYAAESTLIRSKQRLAPPPTLCRRCRAFHASTAGLCSSCAAAPVARVIDEADARDLCVPNLIKQFRRMGRNRRRKRLPAPPSLGDQRTGRALLAARLARHGRTIVDVGGDGACQFRAVSVGLWEDEKHHALVRRKALEVLRAKPPEVHDCAVYVSTGLQIGTVDVGDDFDRYVQALAEDRSWGDHNTLQACSDAFRARIMLVTTHDANYELVVEPRDADAVCEIWIAFHSEMHYVAAAAL